MVVLTILVLMTGVVAVSLVPAMADARLRSGTRIVISALRAARDYAVAHQTQAMVRFRDDRRGLSIEIPDTESGSDEPESWRTLGTPAGHPRTLPTGVEIADTGEAGTPAVFGVTFTALGQGEDARIILIDEHGRQRIILVEALTGRCALADDAP